MRASRWMRTIVALVMASVTAALGAQGGADVTGAGAAPYPPNTKLNLVTLQGLQIGVGATATPHGTVTGDFHVTLIGTSALGVRQEILYDARVDTVSVSEGTATLVGAGTLNMGDGTVPLLSVPFTMTGTADSVELLLGTTALPRAVLTQGAITIK